MQYCVDCVNQLRMDWPTVGLLCELLRSNRMLKNDGVVTVEEHVCMFLTHTRLQCWEL